MKQELINIQGKLADSLKQIDINTWQSAKEINEERKTNIDLRNRWFWTSDIALYTIEYRKSDNFLKPKGKDKCYLYLGSKEVNPIAKRPDEICGEIINQNNYYPTDEEVKAIKHHKDTLRFEIKSDVKDEWFNINALQNKKLAVHIYGKDLCNINKDTLIWMLTPDYIKSKGKSIIRACWLRYFDDDSDDDFDDDSDFVAGVGSVVCRGFGLRGVLVVKK